MEANSSRPALRFIMMALVIAASGIGGFYWQKFNIAQQSDLAKVDDFADIALTSKLIRETTETDEIQTGSIQDGDTIQPLKPLEPLEPLEPEDGLQKPKIIKVQPKAPKQRQKQILAHVPDDQLIERGATGVIPRKSRGGLRPLDFYSRQPATNGNFGVARVVIVVAGLGISQTSTQKAIRDLPGDVTLAFAPYGNSLKRWMETARKDGHELLLQVPMEPYGYPQNNPGIHTLRTDVGVDENLANLHWAMSRISNYVGVMNYLGGKLLSDPRSLKPIFDDISDRGLMFFDDGSVRNSQGKLAAGRSLLPFAQARLQIDAVRTRKAIAEKLNKLADEARRTGMAIGVANAFPETIDMIAEFAKQAKQYKLELTPVSAVVVDPLNP